MCRIECSSGVVVVFFFDCPHCIIIYAACVYRTVPFCSVNRLQRKRPTLISLSLRSLSFPSLALSSHSIHPSHIIPLPCPDLALQRGHSTLTLSSLNPPFLRFLFYSLSPLLAVAYRAKKPIPPYALTTYCLFVTRIHSCPFALRKKGKLANTP